MILFQCMNKQVIKKIFFCDFDETFFPNDLNLEKSGVYELGAYIKKNAREKNFLFGIVSGSRFGSILEKINTNHIFLPNFISSDLGTELYLLNDQKYHLDEDYNSDNKKRFNIQHIFDMVEDFNNSHSNLIQIQSDKFQSSNKVSYYLRHSENFSNHELALKSIAKKLSIKVSITKCNPMAGDPEGFYDVDFIPLGSGKDFIVKYIKNKYNGHPYTIAFGDSFNDFDMFSVVDEAYLVANSHPDAIDVGRSFKNIKILENEYCIGILDIVRRKL